LTTLNESYQDTEGKLGQCNVLVIGKTGVGKSTLVNSVFHKPVAKTGEGYPVTQTIRQYKKSGLPITVYDTPGLELSGEQIDQVQLDVAELIEDKRLEALEEHIHIVWYCIDRISNRLEAAERDWIRALELKDIPIVLVVTKTLSRRRDEFLAWLEAENLPVHQVIVVLAEPMEIDENYTVRSHGLEHLMEVTFELIPEAAKRAFASASKSIKLKNIEASKYVKGYVTGAWIVGACPLLFADAPILATMQTSMFANITLIFGLPFDKVFIGTVLTGMASLGGASLVGRTIANLLKALPGVGTVAGMAISASTAAALTLALGLAYTQGLRRYMQSKLNGEEMSLEDLAKVVAENYEVFVRAEQKSLESGEAA
jgi:small GTP-binding protein